MPGRGLLGVAALEQGRDPAAELDHLEPARDLAHRVGEHLAVLGGEQPGEVLAVGVEELADPEEELGAARERERAPGGEGRLRGLNGERRSPRRTRSRRRRSGRRSPGRRPGPTRPDPPSWRLPPIQWLIAFTACGASISSVIVSSSSRPGSVPRGSFPGMDETLPTRTRSCSRQPRRRRTAPPPDEQDRLAEEPGLWLPPSRRGWSSAARASRSSRYGRSAWVHRLRCSKDDAEVERVVDHVDAMLGDQGARRGDLVARRARRRPRDLAERLLALGLEPDDPPR